VCWRCLKMSKRLNFMFVEPPQPITQSSEVANKVRMRETSLGSQVLPLMWGRVLELTGAQTVDVELTNGLKLKNVPVGSPRWVKAGTAKSDDEATGCKDLPQVGAKVLLGFIDGVMDTPLILPISGFDVLVAAQKATILKDDEQTKVVDVDDYGWMYTMDKETGEITFESPDVDSGIKVTITIDVEGKSIVVSQKMSSSGTDINTLTLDDAGVKIEDKNGNTIEMGTTSVKVNNNLEVLQ
jgi:hypothetical protein